MCIRVAAATLAVWLACTIVLAVTAEAVAIDGTEFAMLDRINAWRASNGKAALKMDQKLSAAATWMARDMGRNNYFGHVDSRDRKVPKRLRAFGYPKSAGKGENIAAGNKSFVATFRQWKKSKAHNKNMLKSSYTSIGIARVKVAGSTYRWYWVTDFGTVLTTEIVPPE